MLRGAIDLVHADQIGGWLYSEVEHAGELKVLAYVDEKCVGAGTVDIMREDLKSAGLGDGFHGFSFPISLEDPADLPRVVIKLDGSDLALLQPCSIIAKAELFRPILANLSRVDWMRQKGMLAPAEVTFLKYLQQLSAFDYSLTQPRSASSKVEMADPRINAQGLFDLLCLRKANLKELELTVRHAEELGLAVMAAQKDPIGVIAIHSAEPGVVSVVEGSHVSGVESCSFDGAIEYQFGPDRLLFLDLNARFKFPAVRQLALHLFVAS